MEAWTHGRMGDCLACRLGFCVERHDAIQQFKPEKFWYVVPRVEKDGNVLELKWNRTRVFDREVGMLFETLLREHATAQ